MSRRISEKQLLLYIDELFIGGMNDPIEFLKYIVIKRTLGNYILEEFLKDLTRTKYTLEKLINVYRRVYNDEIEYDYIRKKGEYKNIDDIMNYLFILYRQGVTMANIKMKLKQFAQLGKNLEGKEDLIRQIIDNDRIPMQMDQPSEIYMTNPIEDKPEKQNTALEDFIEKNKYIHFNEIFLELKDEIVEYDTQSDYFKQLLGKTGVTNINGNRIISDKIGSTIILKDEVINVVNKYLQLSNKRMDPVLYILFMIIDQGKEQELLDLLKKTKRAIDEEIRLKKEKEDILSEKENLEREKEVLRTEQMRVQQKEKEIAVESNTKEMNEQKRKELEEWERRLNQAKIDFENDVNTKNAAIEQKVISLKNEINKFQSEQNYINQLRAVKVLKEEDLKKIDPRILEKFQAYKKQGQFPFDLPLVKLDKIPMEQVMGIVAQFKIEKITEDGYIINLDGRNPQEIKLRDILGSDLLYKTFRAYLEVLTELFGKVSSLGVGFTEPDYFLQILAFYSNNSTVLQMVSNQILTILREGSNIRTNPMYTQAQNMYNAQRTTNVNMNEPTEELKAFIIENKDKINIFELDENVFSLELIKNTINPVLFELRSRNLNVDDKMINGVKTGVVQYTIQKPIPEKLVVEVLDNFNILKKYFELLERMPIDDSMIFILTCMKIDAQRKRAGFDIFVEEIKEKIKPRKMETEGTGSERTIKVGNFKFPLGNKYTQEDLTAIYQELTRRDYYYKDGYLVYMPDENGEKKYINIEKIIPSIESMKEYIKEEYNISDPPNTVILSIFLIKMRDLKQLEAYFEWLEKSRDNFLIEPVTRDDAEDEMAEDLKKIDNDEEYDDESGSDESDDN